MTVTLRDIVTLFGIGRTPFAPGTAGSFAALLVAIPLHYLLGPILLGVLALLVAGGAVWVSGEYAIEKGENDPQDCVIDEVAGQWLTCAFAPLSFSGFLLAFLLFRLFDVAKPWPIRNAEKLEGGLGIVADDMVAGLVAGVVVFLISWSGLLVDFP